MFANVPLIYFYRCNWSQLLFNVNVDILSYNMSLQMPPRCLCQNGGLNVNDCYLFVLYFVTDGTLIFVRGNV